MRLLVFALALTTAVSAYAGDVGKRYDLLRADLIAEGWMPAPVHDDGDWKSPLYPEAKHCFPTGLGACEMVWKRGETIKRVFTEGDAPAVVERIQ